MANKQQTVLMLDYLKKHKSITGLEAITKLGIISYTKCISRLRASGEMISKEWKTHKSKFGVKRYTCYSWYGAHSVIGKKAKKRNRR